MNFDAPIARRTLIGVATLLIGGAFVSLHAAPGRFSADEIRQIRESGIGKSVLLDKVMLPVGEADLRIEEFDVLAPGAVFEAIGEGGVVTPLARPAVRYFRGSVEGDPESLVFLAMGKEVGGFIVTEGRKLRVASIPRVRAGAVRRMEDFEISVEEVPLSEEMSAEDVWSCDVDDFSMNRNRQTASVASAMEHVEADELSSPTATYVLLLALEADRELYVRQGSNSTTALTYLMNLVAAGSVIYERDMRTELRLQYAAVHTAAVDPFTMDPSGLLGHSTFDALLELGRRWHDTPPSALPRSATMLISGKDVGAGVAWVDWICGPDFDQAGASAFIPDGWGGSYGLLMDAGLATNFDPDGNPDFLADDDRFGFEYWPVLAFAHELGHTVQSSHTHCITLTAQDKLDYGVTRNFVDECFSDEDVGCYDDPDSGAGNDPSRLPHAVNANLPAELGTVMSYCHLTTGNPVGFGAATRFTFGQPGEPGMKVIGNMEAALETWSPSLTAAITAPASVNSGVSSMASIPLPIGMAYQWTIENGAITNGAAGNTVGGAATVNVEFTGATSPVTLRITVVNGDGCAASDFRTITVNSLALAAPTSLVATAASSTSVDVSWDASVGATGYQVRRSADGTTFSLVGSTAGTALTDTTAAANTAYVYKVRATAPGTNSAYSNEDVATTVIFTNSSIVAGTTEIKAVHVTELRTGINALRTLAGLSEFSFTDGSLTGVPVEALHFNELLDAMTPALVELSIGLLVGDPLPDEGGVVQRMDVLELRNGLN